MKILIVIGAVLILCCFSTTASACMCGLQRPCQAYAAAQTAFVGQVTGGFTRKPEGRMPGEAISATFTSAEPVTRFRVIEAFRGVSGNDVEVAGTGTTCDFHFEQGNTYVVYAYKDSNSGKLHTSICSRTGLLADTNKDLAYLRIASRLPDGGVVSGSVDRSDWIYGTYRSHRKPLAGAKVIFESEGHKYIAIANKRGRYVIRLPAGKYRVHTAPLTNWTWLSSIDEEPRHQWTITATDHGCIPLGLSDFGSGSLSGQVISDSTTTDLPEVELIPIHRKVEKMGVMMDAVPDKQGRFVIWNVLPGRYFLGFNVALLDLTGTDRRRSYYPGVTDRRHAKVIVIRRNSKLSGFILKVPSSVQSSSKTN